MCLPEILIDLVNILYFQHTKP